MASNVMVLVVLTSLRDGRIRWWVVGGARARERAVHGDMPSTWSMATSMTHVKS